MQSKALELLVGLFFSLGVGAVFILTFRVASVSSAGSGANTYQVAADFENIGGLKPGAAVTLAGVRIGRVRSIVIDRTTFEAHVTMGIEKQYDNIPVDSSASIMTAGLLGEQYLGLSPGGDDKSLKDGDKVKFTQSALVLENLIGQFMANMASGKKDSGEQNSAPQPASK
jgi:phospholipid/cholesterol/gamma-HCH transport system substrate-binding protein